MSAMQVEKTMTDESQNKLLPCLTQMDFFIESLDK